MRQNLRHRRRPAQRTGSLPLSRVPNCQRLIVAAIDNDMRAGFRQPHIMARPRAGACRRNEGNRPSSEKALQVALCWCALIQRLIPEPGQKRNPTSCREQPLISAHFPAYAAMQQKFELRRPLVKQTFATLKLQTSPYSEHSQGRCRAANDAALPKRNSQ